MARPRKQTYTMDLFLKNLKELDIRTDQDVQRLSGQWSNGMMNELIATVLKDDYIPPIVLGQEKNSQMWVVDGLQRSTTLMKFRYGNYKVTAAIEEPIITYRAKCRDSEGNVKIDGNGDIVWEDRQVDIRHKTYDRLPEELKKNFDEYQVETVIHEGYEMAEISKLVRRYNFNKPMNVSQRAFTFVGRYGRRIREMLRGRFFVECTAYTRNERRSGVLERIIMESVMCMFHLDSWKKSGQLGEYINENASAEEFGVLENLISRLENIMTESLYGIFTSKDSFLWFTLFHRFTQTGYDDGRFADFLAFFQEMTKGQDMNGFYGIDKNSSTKDKNTVIKKLEKLEGMMYRFLGIVRIKLDEEMKAGILGFVQENAAPLAAMEDVEQYAEVLETLAQNIGQSKLWEDGNLPSLIAIVAWSFECDIDLDRWLADYSRRNNTYANDQAENYAHMRDDLEQFIKQTAVA